MATMYWMILMLVSVCDVALSRSLSPDGDNDCAEVVLGLVSLLDAEETGTSNYTKKDVVSFITGVDLDDPEVAVAVGCDILEVASDRDLWMVLDHYDIIYNVFGAFYDYFALNIKTYLNLLKAFVDTPFSPYKQDTSAAIYALLLRIRDSGVLELDPEGLDVVGEYVYPGEYEAIKALYPLNTTEEPAFVLCDDITDLFYDAVATSAIDIRNMSFTQSLLDYGGVDITDREQGHELVCDVVGASSLEELFSVAESYEIAMRSLVRWVGDKLQKYKSKLTGAEPNEFPGPDRKV